MTLRSIPPPFWMAAALFPMVASQIVRLHQPDPAAWVFWDYAGRLAALAILGIIPSARAVAFRVEPLRMPRSEAAIWILGIVLADHYVGDWVRRTMNAGLPATVLGTYPDTHGWLRVMDIAFGLALVALSEEIVFRRCARQLLRNYLSDGCGLVCVASLVFGAYHWWSGIGNISAAVLIGGLLMLLYRRSGALWPAILGHYLTDIVGF